MSRQRTSTQQPSVPHVRTVPALILSCTLAIAPAIAQTTSAGGFLSGTDLVEVAKKNEQFALGYIGGVVDATLPLFRIRSALFCLPHDAKLNDVARSALNLIRRDVKYQAYQAASSVAAALATIYPCKQ